MKRVYVLILLLFSSAVFAVDGVALPEGVFARVAGEDITTEQYHAYYAAQMRERFYHGKVPEAELVGFDESVLQDLVGRVLVRQEVSRRQLVVDEGAIKASVSEWSLRHGNDVPEALLNLEYQKRYDEMAAVVLREQVDDAVVLPNAQELRGFYEANEEKFTRPEQLKISLILLKVAPYAEAVVWQAAYDRAQGLLERLEVGEKFAVLAQEFSDHESAQVGGDLGFVHAGMLSSEVQDIVNGLAEGEVVSKPVVLLQGVALLQLERRRVPVLLDFEQVEERVTALLLKERREQAWGDLLARLKKENPVQLRAR